MFEGKTYADLTKLFAPRKDGDVTRERRPPSAKAARLFRDGDHFQGGRGFIGQLPPAVAQAQEMLRKIEEGFVSENVIGESADTHLWGVLGREPNWSFLPADVDPKEVTDEQRKEIRRSYAPLVDWWNTRDCLALLKRAADAGVVEGGCALHLFIPRGRVPKSGVVSARNLASALDFIYCEALPLDSAGVFTDPDTQAQFSVRLFEERDAEGNATDKGAELSYLNEEGETVLRVVREKGDPADFGPYKLGGRLFIHEINRRPLVTEQVMSNQRALNLALTMLQRNVNLAGSRERTVSNAQDPKTKRKVQDPADATKTKVVEEPGFYVTGPAGVNWLLGWPIRNEKGQIVGYTNPNVSVTDPVKVTTFKETRDILYAAILGQCHQRHVLISGDASASGRSREQARAEFERSLKETKGVTDAAGRWLLEITLRLAAQLCDQTGAYSKLRADFNCTIDPGEPDPEKRRIVMEMRKPGGPQNLPLISDETARVWAGIDDPAAELATILEESESSEGGGGRPPAPPVEDKTGEGLPA